MSVPDPRTCEDCGISFPLIAQEDTTVGKCQCPKCKKADTYEFESQERNEVLKWLQCVLCGTAFRNMPPPTGDVQLCRDPKCYEFLMECGSTSEPAIGTTGSIPGLANNSSATTATPSMSMTTTCAPPSTQVPLLRSESSGAPSVHGPGAATNQVSAPSNASSKQYPPQAYLERVNFMRRVASARHVPLAPAVANPLSTKALLDFKYGGGVPGEDLIMVEVEAKESSRRARNSQNNSYGKIVKPYSASLFLSEVTERIVRSINEDFTRSGRTQSLTPDDVILRLRGNISLDDGLSSQRLSEIYDHYDGPFGNSAAFSSKTGTAKSTKGNRKKTITFECIIDIAAYEKRTNMNQSIGISTIVPLNSQAPQHSKRRRPTESLSDDDTSTPSSNTQQGVKRTRTSMAPPPDIPSRGSRGQGMISEFSSLPPKRSGQYVMLSQTPVLLTRVNALVDENGKIDLIRDTSKVSGALVDTPVTKGKMKKAFKFCLDNGEQMIAKRFYRTEGANDLDPDSDSADFDNAWRNDANPLTMDELKRVHLGKYFLKKFYGFARARGVEVDQNITFTDAFVGIEDGAIPTPAAGVKEADNYHEGRFWLIEPLRSSSVTRFSGTLNHTSHRTGKQASTIYAWVHFAFAYSHKHYVFADLQGSLQYLSGANKMVLFDPMTHTQNGESGIGDFGREGMECFLRDHECNDICMRLGLNMDHPTKNLTGTSVLDEVTPDPTNYDSEDEQENDELDDEEETTAEANN